MDDMSRTGDRAVLDIPNRVFMLEADMDSGDEKFERLAVAVQRMTWALVGLTLTLAGSCITLVLTKAVGG